MFRFTVRRFMSGGAGGNMGMSLGEVRERVETLRKRNDPNPMKLVEAEMAFLHLLSQTGRDKEALECLELGDSMWAKFDAEARNSPNGAQATRGLCLHLCTTMRHVSKGLGDHARAGMWVHRLGALHDAFMNAASGQVHNMGNGSGSRDDSDDNEQFDNNSSSSGPKLGANIRKFDLDERGVRKNAKWRTGNGVSDSFGDARHPLTDLPFMRSMKGYKSNPDLGPRY